MPISKIPVGAIQSGTIGTSQIADNAVTTAKILNDNVTSAKIPNDAIGSTEIASSAVTRDELQSAAVNNISSDSIILNSTNGTADAGDFLVLDGTDGSSSNANHRILFDDTFVDKIGLFNINTLGSAGQALKVNDAGNSFEFGAVEGGLVHLGGTTASGATSVDFTETGGVIDFTKFRRYYVRIAGVGNWGSTGSSYLAARVFVNNSVNSSNAYRYANLRHRYSSSSTSGNGAQATHWVLFTSNYYSNTGQNMSGDFTIDFSPYYVSMWAFGQSYGNTSFGAIQTTITSGAYYGHTSSQDVDGISFLMSSGTLTGRFDIYGYTNSAGGTDLGA
jgi:hypothetical protein